MTLTLFILIILAFVFIIGVCIGSFLNVVILRAFSNESIAYPASKCPSCQTPLKWYHNIPILSYLLLKGKCSFCKDLISVQYPIVEFTTGLLFVLIFLKLGLTANSIFIMIFASLFIVLSVTDIKEKVVFDFHTYSLLGCGLIYSLFNIGNFYPGQQLINIGSISFGINNSIIAVILGVLAGIIIMEAFARFGYLIAGTRAFGEGDTYIAAGLGAIFGWKYLLTVLVYGFVIQIFFTIPVFIKKLYSRKDYQTLVGFISFFGLIILMKWIENTNLQTGIALFGIFAISISAIGIYLCIRIIRGLKSEGQENMTYLPFGPAMVIGAMLFLLFFHFAQ